MPYRGSFYLHQSVHLSVLYLADCQRTKQPWVWSHSFSLHVKWNEMCHKDWAHQGLLYSNSLLLHQCHLPASQWNIFIGKREGGLVVWWHSKKTYKNHLALVLLLLAPHWPIYWLYRDWQYCLPVTGMVYSISQVFSSGTWPLPKLLSAHTHVVLQFLKPYLMG